MSCLKKKRKPIMPLKTLDIIFRRRYLPNTQYYFANRRHAVPSEITKTKRIRPFCVPKSEKLLSYIKYSDKKEKLTIQERHSQPLHLKDNMKIADTRDISKRLFIKEPVDDVRAVVEIHPEFYRVIEGRPSRRSDDIKVYINNIRSYAMNRQQIGYRQDLILTIDQNIAEEIKGYNTIVENLKKHIKNFQKFLTEDYKKACAKVSKAEKVYAELSTKNLELLGYVSKTGILNNVIFKLDAIRNVLKVYRRYLIFVAPLSWRQVHDETLRGRVQSIQFESGDFATDNDLVGTYLDIDKIIEAASIEFRQPLPACMYFKKPVEMLYLFRTIELQSRMNLMYLTTSDTPFRLLQDRIKALKAATQQELDYFQYCTDNINTEMSREIYNEKHLRDKFFRILNESFYHSVASPSTLKLKICIEYVYEQVLGKCEEGHQSLQDPMKILEVMYEDYNLRLDALDFKTVKQAQKDFFAQDLKMMTNAYKGQRELRAFREMTNAMNKAFLPPSNYKRPCFKKFTSSLGAKKLTSAESGESQSSADKRDKRTKHKITPEERDGLMMFTEWCEGMHPGPYLEEYYKYVKPAFEWVPRKSVYM